MTLALFGPLTERWLLALTLLVTIGLAPWRLPVAAAGKPLSSETGADPRGPHVILGGGEDGSKSRFEGQLQLREGGEHYTAENLRVLNAALLETAGLLVSGAHARQNQPARSAFSTPAACWPTRACTS